MVSVSWVEVTMATPDGDVTIAEEGRLDALRLLVGAGVGGSARSGTFSKKKRAWTFVSIASMVTGELYVISITPSSAPVLRAALRAERARRWERWNFAHGVCSHLIKMGYQSDLVRYEIRKYLIA